MKDEPRDSGIDVIGRVPWGTHFCQFYQTKQDLIDILVPYFKAGLENNEFCMWITSEPLEVAEARVVMRGAVKDFDKYLGRGQIEIMPYDEWYLLGDAFDDDRVLRGWVGKLEQALARGYEGLRLTGNTFWLERNHWAAFTEYEAMVNDVIGKYRMLAICTYCLDKCDGAAVIDVVKNHQFALIKHEGRWDIIESDIYKKAKEEITHLASFPELNPNPVLELDTAGNIKYLNPAARALFPDLPSRGSRHPFLADWEIVLGVLREKKSHTVTRDIKIGESWYEQSYVLMPSIRDVRLYVRDITERKKMEEALLERESDLNRAQEVSHTGSWRLDVRRNQLLWSEETHRIFGIPAGTPMTYETFLSSVHPDDREFVDRKWAESLRGEPYDIEHRIIVGSEMKWVREKAELEFDEVETLKGGFGTVQDITERKLAEETLSAANAELNAIYSNVPVAIMLVDRDRRVHKVNEAAARFSRRQTDEMLGLRGGEAIRCLHSLDDPRGCGFGPSCEDCVIRRAVLDTFDTHKPRIGIEARLFTIHDGVEEESWLLVSTAFLRLNSKGMVLVCAQDITNRKRVENELRVKDYAVASAISGIAMADLDGSITYVNLACLGMWGYDKEEEIIGKQAAAFFADNTRATEALRAILEEEAWQGEIKAKRKDGTTFDVEVSANLVNDADGEPFCIMVSSVDVTERKKLEQLKDEFIGLVSHELRTPLTVISGCLSTVLTEWDRLPVGETQQLLGEAILESESLSHLVENLLELSRYQAQQLTLYAEPVDVKILARETIEKIKRQAPSQRFSVAIPDKLPPVNADPLRIERIFYNLLDNATKYSPPASLIRVSATLEPGRLVIGVRDRGKGLSPEEQTQLFNPFQRLENNMPGQVRGAGLGLLVCRRLVEAHGGEIWIESKRGRGSTFFFSLPHQQRAGTPPAKI